MDSLNTSALSLEGNHNFPPMSFLEKRLLRQAVVHFRQGEYSEASSLFFQVMTSRPLDVRVRHNLAVAQFHHSHLQDADRFQQELLDIISQANIGSGHDSATEITCPVFLYNLAVIYFQDRQPWKSLEIAINLVKHLCSIDPHVQAAFRSVGAGALAFRLRILVTEIYITLQKYDLALNEIEIAANVIEVLRISPTEDRDSSTKTLTEYVAKVKMKELRALSLLSSHSVSLGRLEYKDFRNLVSGCDDEPGRLAVHFLKAYHNYLGGNIRKALTVISAISMSNSGDFFKKTGDNLAMMLNNNIGCCHYSMGKPTVAAWFFQKASQEENKDEYKDRQTLPLHCLSFNRKYEIMYNFGVSLLHAKKSLEAFTALSRCQSAFSANPRLWLRLAECCAQLHKSSNTDDFALTEEKRNIFVGIETTRSEPILPTEINACEKPTPSLHYGLQCIVKAISLISSEPMELRPSNGVSDISEINNLIANVLCVGAYINLSLGNYAEAIGLANDLLAFSSAPNVFQYLGRLYLSEAMFKAREIRSEQDLFSDKCFPNCSLTLTTSAAIGANGSRLSSPSSSTFKPASEWTPREDNTAKATIVYNRAVALTQMGQFESALGLIDEWIQGMGQNGPIPPDFILLSIHLYLKLGNIDRAAEIYRQHCPQAKSHCRVPLTSD